MHITKEKLEGLFKNTRINLSLIFVVIFGFYLRTLAPGILWSDSGKLAINAKEMLINFTSLSSHSLHAILSRIFILVPLGNFVYRQNLMSAFFASLTVIILYLIIKRITESNIASIFGSFAFAVSHMFWLLSVVNETYTIATFFISLQVLILLVWYDKGDDRLLYLTSLVLGISMLNNWITLFCFPAYFYLIYVRKREVLFSLNKILMIIGCFILGASPFFYSILESKGGQFSGDFIKVVKTWVNPKRMITGVVKYPVYLMYEFPVAGFFVGLLGVWKSFFKKRKIFFFLLILLLCNVLFAMSYIAQRRFHILVSSYLFFSVWIGIGICELKKWLSVRNFILGFICLAIFPILFYYNMPAISKKVNIDLIKARRLHFRDNDKFYLFPAKNNEFGPYRYGKLAFEVFEPDSIVLADFNPGKVLEYFQRFHNLRPDVKIESQRIDRFLHHTENPEERILNFISRQIEKAPIYLADDYEPYYFCKAIKKKYDIIPIGSVFKVNEK
ncbi:DUF2723 domain-containing protein [bacterium]|nr:DUF2723 domain-containing protein [bacterium]